MTYLGLNEAEMNEFIVYRLPLTQCNNYNLISFRTNCYTDNVKLDISPKSDNEHRVFMTVKALDKPVKIEPQKLETFESKGFTVVE